MTNATPSQTELYGELRTNEQQYRVDLAPIEKLTQEQEQALVERIRMGDVQARSELVTHLLPILSRVARKYAYLYEIDYLDLVQDASLQMLDSMDVALTKEEPVGYLLGAIFRHIRYIPYQSLYGDHERDRLTSLDAPIGDDDSEVFLYELIPTPDLAPEPLRGPRDYHPLYQAINALPPCQRAIILRRHGIHEQAPEPLCDIQRDLGITKGGMAHQVRKAYGTLYFALAPTYPTYAEDNAPLMERSRLPAYADGTWTITTDQRQRLDDAYAALQASGQKITGKTLAAAAHIDSTCALSYLREHRNEQEAPTDQRQRLDDAYATLQASGQEIAARTLAAAAHVGQLTTALYLKQREPDRMRTVEQRLDDAYATLQASGQKITVRTLAAAAHVDGHRVAAYLKQRENLLENAS